MGPPTEVPEQGQSSTWRVEGDPLVTGASVGVLRGHTVAVKDTYAVAGHPRGAGNPTWLAEAAAEQRNAAAVQALLDAGADIAGITQVPEFAYSLSGTNVHYGTPPNPAAEGRVPGGSSSGSASAVASGSVDIGLGSDTAGSIRVPASYCGLFGLRVTHGSVPTDGLLPLAPRFDAVGWLTRDAETLERVASVLLPDVGTAPLERVVLATDLFELAEPAVRSALAQPTDQTVSVLGLPHERVSAFGADQIGEWVDAFVTVQAAQAWESLGAWIEDHPGALGPEIAQRFDVGRQVSGERRQAAESILTHARTVVDDLVRPGTVLVQPAASTPAPPPTMPAAEVQALRTGTLRLTCPAGIAGLPVVTLPAGTVEGCPVGLSLVGPRGSDRTLAATARSLGEGRTASGGRS